MSKLTSKINVLHITFDMEIGGTEQVIRHLVEQGDQDRFNFSILCIDGKIGSIGKEIQSHGFDVFNFNRNQGIDWQLLKRIRQYITVKQIDVLHSHQYTPYFYAVLAAMFTTTAVVFTEHGRFYPDSYKLKRWLINPVLSLFTQQITAISQATANALSRYENFPKNKIRKIYNGIHYLYRPASKEKLSLLAAELGIESSTQIIGTISRLDSIKNQALMISTLASLLLLGVKLKLLIVGDGPEFASLQELAADLKVTENVIFTGFQLDPAPYLQLMDVFLLTSYSEGTSITLIEAMACGKPVIVTDVGGNPEVVINNETGLVIASDDLEGLKDALLKLLDDMDLKNKFSKSGKLRFEQYFNIKNMVQQYQEIYLANKTL